MTLNPHSYPVMLSTFHDVMYHFSSVPLSCWNAGLRHGSMSCRTATATRPKNACYSMRMCGKRFRHLNMYAEHIGTISDRMLASSPTFKRAAASTCRSSACRKLLCQQAPFRIRCNYDNLSTLDFSTPCLAVDVGGPLSATAACSRCSAHSPHWCFRVQQLDVPSRPYTLIG